MELKGTDLKVAVNALIGSMVKNGYIDQLANSVLVSVENDDAAKGAALNEKIVAEIDQLLQSSAIQGAVVGQTLTGDDELRQLADSYQISTGKAALIQEILAKSPCSSLKTWRPFHQRAQPAQQCRQPVQEDSQSQQGQQISTGVPSDKAYVGEDKAREAALCPRGRERLRRLFPGGRAGLGQRQDGLRRGVCRRRHGNTTMRSTPSPDRCSSPTGRWTTAAKPLPAARLTAPLPSPGPRSWLSRPQA